MTTRHQSFTFAPDVVFRPIDGEGLLLGLNQEVVFSLNASGSRIAQLVADRRDFGQIVDTLSEEYGVPVDDIAPDVVQLLDLLEARGLVVRGSGEGQ